MTTTPDLATLAEKLSAHAQFTINDGDDSEWYGRTERAAEELERLGLARRPFSHDRKCLAPTALGIALRLHLKDNAR